MVEGTCLCGEVRFSVEGELPDLYQGHCGLCRKVTGAAADAALTMSAESFGRRAGADSIETFVRDTGYRNDVCARCGSTVPDPARDGLGCWIPAGLFDTAIGSRVSKHAFTGSKADRDVGGGTARRFAGPPDSWA